MKNWSQNFTSANGKIHIQFWNGLLTFLIKRIAHFFNLISRNSTHPSMIFWGMPSSLQNCTAIDDKGPYLIIHCRKSLLFLWQWNLEKEINRKLLWCYNLSYKSIFKTIFSFFFNITFKTYLQLRKMVHCHFWIKQSAVKTINL